MLELNKIYLGDCLEVMKDISDNSIDLVITDSPYKLVAGGKTSGNMGGIIAPNKLTSQNGKMFKENDVSFGEWLPSVYRVLKEGTHFYSMVNDRNMNEMLNESKKVGFKLLNILTWKKNNCTPNKYYMKNLEFIVLLRKGRAKNINNMGNKQCIEVSNIIGNKKHPSEKPIELMEKFILNSSDKNDIVLDLFIGSGTTAIACVNTDRNYIGIEKDEQYFNVAINRVNGK